MGGKTLVQAPKGGKALTQARKSARTYAPWTALCSRRFRVCCKHQRVI